MSVARPLHPSDAPSARYTGSPSDITSEDMWSVFPRGLNQVVSGGPGSVDGGDGSGTHDNAPSSSGSSSSSHAGAPSNVATKVVIPLLVALALVLFAAVVLYLILRFRRGSRRRMQRARGLLPTVATEKPRLFEVHLESPPPVHSATPQWDHIKPLSAKYIPQDVYALEQAVAASLSSYPGTPATSRPASMQTSSSRSSRGSRTSKAGTDGGRLRVAVTIAMPSPRSSQFVDEKAVEKKAEEEAPPLYLGVADLPWCAEKVEEA